MTNLSFSNWLLTPGNALPSSSEKREAFCPIQLNGGLARWENEGGAVHENDTVLLNSQGTDLQLHTL
jgi:hypothetical protein